VGNPRSTHESKGSREKRRGDVGKKRGKPGMWWRTWLGEGFEDIGGGNGGVGGNAECAGKRSKGNKKTAEKTRH